MAGELYELPATQSAIFTSYLAFSHWPATSGRWRCSSPTAMELGQGDGADALMAATTIAHRVGKPALVHELLKSAHPDHGQPGDADAQAQADEIARMILSRPVQEVEEYFALFYRGFQPQDARVADELIRQNKG